MMEGHLSRWRQAIEAIDLCTEDSRQRLNQLYTEMINQLLQEFQAATITLAASSLDQKQASEAANPDAQTERL